MTNLVIKINDRRSLIENDRTSLTEMIVDHSNPSHQPVFPVFSHETSIPNQVARDAIRYDFAFCAGSFRRKMNAHGPSPILSSRPASHDCALSGVANMTGVPRNEASSAPKRESSCWTGSGKSYARSRCVIPTLSRFSSLAEPTPGTRRQR